MLADKLKQATASRPKIADVFDITTYTGTGSAQTITTGVNMASYPGFVWLKNLSRSNKGHAHFFSNQLTSGANFLTTSGTDSTTLLSTAGLTTGAGSSNLGMSSTGFSLGTDTAWAINNFNVGDSYQALSIRQGSKFFDIRQVTKSASSDVVLSFSRVGTIGMVWVKATNATSNWLCWHRSLTSGNLIRLDSVNGEYASTDVTVSGSTVTLAAALPNATYMVYVFGHDTLTGSNIVCGEYTGTGSAGTPTITTGFEPGLILIKEKTATTDPWYVFNTIRGGASDPHTFISDQSPEASFGNAYSVTSTGFSLQTTDTTINQASSSYIYMAIRKP
jgi:hypothetical protein